MIRVGDPSLGPIDVRKFVRYSRVFSVLLTWTGRTGREILGEGLTRDISAGGMFVLVGKSIPHGVPVHYEVRLPALHRTGCGVRIAGIGQVARVEKTMESGQWWGVAVQFSRPMVRVAATPELQALAPS